MIIKLCETPHAMSSMADNKLQGLFKEHKKLYKIIKIIKKSPCQHIRKCIENSIENMHTDVRV